MRRVRRRISTHVKERVWPTGSVECGAGEHAEAELLVETARRLILFVYVDGERAPAKLLRMLDELTSAPSTDVRRIEEQCLDRVAGHPEESDGDAAFVSEDPELERVAGEELDDERAIEIDVLFGEEGVGSADGALPERDKRRVILGLFAADGQGVRRLEATSFQIWNVSLEQIWLVGQVVAVSETETRHLRYEFLPFLFAGRASHPFSASPESRRRDSRWRT